METTCLHHKSDTYLHLSYELYLYSKILTIKQNMYVAFHVQTKK